MLMMEAPVKKIWILGCLVALALAAGCKKKTCPECPAAPACPEPSCDLKIDDGGKAITALAYRLVEKDGKWVMTAVGADGKAIAIPLDPNSPAWVDGKLDTVSGLLGGPGGGGGCPCRIPACIPFCRPVASLLDKPPGELFPGLGGGSGITPAGGSGAEPGQTPPAPEK